MRFGRRERSRPGADAPWVPGAHLGRRTGEAPRPGRDHRRQRARRRSVRRLRRTAPWLAAAAFASGVLGSETLLASAASRRPDLFAVDRFEVRGHQRVSGAQLATIAGLPAGTSLASVDDDALCERLMAHPWIASARLAVIPPDKLLLEVEERVPAAVAQRGEQLWWVDRSGLAFAPLEGARPEALPVLLLAAAPDPTRPEPLLATGVALARYARALDLPVRSVELGGGGDGGADDAFPALRIEGTSARVVLGPGEWEARLRRLVRVLAEVSESRDAGEIDLRVPEQAILRPSGDTAGEKREGAESRSRATAPTSGPDQGADANTGGRGEWLAETT